MSSYHLYYLKDGMLLGADSIEAADDGEAARIAKERGAGKVVEVWNSHARIRVLAPAQAVAQHAAHTA